MSNLLGLCISLCKSNLFLVVMFSFKFCDMFFKVFKLLSFLFMGFVGSEGVMSMFYGYSVGGIFNDNGG